jgi:flagellar M-ring protein FliF
MKDSLVRVFDSGRTTFGGFTAGQKVVSILGTLALLLGGFMVFRWASAPDYAPLFSDMSAADASAVVDQLDSDGTPYELADGGTTVMVPRNQVYSTRIALSGEGLPANSDEGGYSILDNQGMSLSEEQQDTNFKRAMEGELAKTIEAIDGVDTAVVHLAIPEKEVFAEEQNPVTASVLIKTRPGVSLDPEQVQAVVNLVASSIDGLDPDNVSVADSTGKVLTSPGGGGADGGGTRAQMVEDVQTQYQTKLQSMLDRVLGPGNSTVQVTADLDFDDTVVETKDYTADPTLPPLSESTNTETYTGAGAPAAGGVVGPDGQMETDPSAAGADSNYEKNSTTRDNAIDETRERRVTAPGSINKLNVGVALDLSATTLANVNANEVRQLITATAGLDKARGDTIAVSEFTFDRSAEKSAAEELAKADSDAAAAARRQQFRDIGLAVLVALLVLGALLAARRRAKKRDKTAEMLVEQIRADQESRVTATQMLEPVMPAELALAEADSARGKHLRSEVDDLISRQPDDVATLLRGWLAERP